jgi:hypothetical protein
MEQWTRKMGFLWADSEAVRELSSVKIISYVKHNAVSDKRNFYSLSVF